MLADYYLRHQSQEDRVYRLVLSADFEYLADPAIKQVIVQGANSDDLLLRLLMAGIDRDNIYLAETEQEAADMSSWTVSMEYSARTTSLTASRPMRFAPAWRSACAGRDRASTASACMMRVKPPV